MRSIHTIPEEKNCITDTRQFQVKYPAHRVVPIRRSTDKNSRLEPLEARRGARENVKMGGAMKRMEIEGCFDKPNVGAIS